MLDISRKEWLVQHVTGLDEMFLSYDTLTTNGNLGGIAVFDPAPGDGTPGVAPLDRVGWLRARIAQRLDTLPPLRWRLAPFGVDRFWAEGPVDLDYHVTGISLDAPGTERQLLDRLGAIMSVHLDRSKPLWRFYVVQGLAGGRYAYFLKIHHGLADGAAMWTIFDHLSDEPVTDPQRAPIEADSPFALAQAGMKRYLDLPLQAATLMTNVGKWLGERMHEEQAGAMLGMMARLMPGEMGAPLVALANATKLEGVPQIASQRPVMMPPPSPFNGTTTRNVDLELVDFAVADLRRAAKAVGGTVNDAVLAITAGALRTYMQAHGGVPPVPLLASAPISWRTGTETKRWSNQIWMLFLQLPTHLSDPVERMHFAHQAATAAKNNWDRMPLRMIREMSALMPGAMVSMMGPMMTMMPAELMPAIYNVSVSNVRGPADRPVFDGSPMARYFVYGFLAPTTGLLVGGQSLGDRMVIGLTGCRDLVKDLDQLPAFFQLSLQELLDAAASPAEKV